MKPYQGTSYWELDQIESWCHALVAAAPEWVKLERVGTSRQGRDLLLLTIGDVDGRPEDRPAFWLDGGMHCVEWTGVMACIYTMSRWVEALLAGDAEIVERFRRNTAYVMPCISPDGYQAMRSGAPFIRSTLRPPRDARPRVGLEAGDIDGDGRALWMRWKSASGPWVFDGDNPIRMRHRTLDDAPEGCWNVCAEGRFLHFDGVHWHEAARQHGLDLNRNFPSSWAPFEMFGMDAGTYPLSEPESLAVVQAFSARTRIGCALTNHTYTGCLLTQPYRDPSPLDEADIRRMEKLAEGATDGTGYRVMRVVPDFSYDSNKAIVGVWADAMTTTFGVPGYTLELWDPYGHNGVTIEEPAVFFRKPDLAKVGQMLDGFYEKDPTCVIPWRAFEHPELGPVEIGGLDYLHTVRNPPVEHLLPELIKGYQIANRLLRALPQVTAELRIRRHGDVQIIELLLENHGYLGTSSLRLAEGIGAAPPLRVELDGVEPIEGATVQALGWLAGWSDLQLDSASMPVYPGLPLERSARTAARWVVRGEGTFVVRWDAGRGGCGTIEDTLRS